MHFMKFQISESSFTLLTWDENDDPSEPSENPYSKRGTGQGLFLRLQ